MAGNGHHSLDLRLNDSLLSPDDDTNEKGPERTCIVTRAKATPDAMIRFVVGPDETVVPDIRRKLPGRGVWVTASQTVVAEAVRKQAFSRGFKIKVKAAATLGLDVGDLLARDALQSLAMANKASGVITGFAKVESALAARKVAALLHAAEAGDDGVRKLEGAARRAAEGGETPLSIKVFSAEQLELALGGTNVIHAALAVGPAGYAFLTRCRRLMMYRSVATHDIETDAKAASA